MDDPSKKELYRRYLRGLLLSNEIKGRLFRSFLEFTSRPKKKTNIENKFGRVPAKTLIAFCLEAGLTVKYGEFMKSVEARSVVSVSEFCKSLTRVYRNLQEDPTRVSPIYVPIDVMRGLVSLDLGLESPLLFDKLLEEAIDSKFGESIYLHGAPPQVISESNSFYYKGKRYAYISVRMRK